MKCKRHPENLCTPEGICKECLPKIHKCPRHPDTLCVYGWPCHVCVWFDSGEHRATPFARWLDDGMKEERGARPKKRRDDLGEEDVKPRLLPFQVRAGFGVEEVPDGSDSSEA